MGQINLATKNIKRSKINFKLEWQFIRECENNCHSALAGKKRFIELLHIINEIPEPKSILDVGGNLGTARWLKAKFPNSKITILNKSKKELGSYPNIIEGDAESFEMQEKYDLIFAGEVLEHTYNPDGLICSCLLALKPKGHLIITTPNLACIYNRFFLLFGWSPANYSPSLRYLTGNPFYSNKIGDFGIIGDHKSVFTWKGLNELLILYGAHIIAHRGYSYGQEEIHKTIGDRYYNVPAGKFRLILDTVLPRTLREGMLFLCQAPANMDLALLKGGILKESYWEL